MCIGCRQSYRYLDLHLQDLRPLNSKIKLYLSHISAHLKVRIIYIMLSSVFWYVSTYTQLVNSISRITGKNWEFLNINRIDISKICSSCTWTDTNWITFKLRAYSNYINTQQVSNISG